MIPDSWAWSNRLAQQHPAEKCLLVFLMLAVAFSAQCLLPLVLIFCYMTAVTIYKAGIPVWVYVKTLLGPLAFILAGTCAVLLDTGKTGTLTSSASIHAAAEAACRAVSSAACLIFLCLTTPCTDICWVFSKLKMPKLAIELFSLTYRCIFILMDVADTISTTQASRLGYSSMKSGYRSCGMLCGAVLIRALDKAKLLNLADQSRCGDGGIGFMQPAWIMSKKNILAALIPACIIAACGFSW